MLQRNLDASDANIDILKTTIENMGNELILYKSQTETIREKQIRYHTDVESTPKLNPKPTKELSELKQSILNKDAEISSLKTTIEKLKFDNTVLSKGMSDMK